MLSRSLKSGLITSWLWAGAQVAAPFVVTIGIPVAIPIAIDLAIPSPATAAELEQIQQRGYLIVAVKDNLPPLGFRNASGELDGLEIDLAHRLAEALLGDRNAVRFHPVSNAERLNAVLDGTADLAIARLTMTGSRARIVDFSLPYYLDGTALVTRTAAQRASDLSGQRIAVLNGSTTIAVVRSQLPGAQLVGVDSYQAAYALLENNQAAAFAADASVLAGWVRDDSDYHLLPDLLSGEPLSVVMPRGIQYDPLRRQVNSAIERWRGDGWLQERLNYWGLPE